MNERIRLLREHYNLSRAAFGERLGVSGDVINNLERGRVEAKDHIIKLLISEFSCSESWLRTGEGEMFDSSEPFSLNDYVKVRGMSDLEFEILKIYLELDPEIRHTILDHFKNRLTTYDNAAAKEESTGNTGLIEPTTEDLEAEYKKIILNQQSEQAVTASSSTNGSSAKVAE